MKVTDFSKISNHYDDNPYRIEELDVDQDLKQLINQRQNINL